MKTNLMLILTAVTSTVAAQNVSSPDGRLSLAIQTGAETTYSVTYDGKTVLNPSTVGLVADYADLAKDLKLIKADVDTVVNSYDMTRTKAAHSDYKATRLRCVMQNPDGWPIDIVFQVSNNDIALRYEVNTR